MERNAALRNRYSLSSCGVGKKHGLRYYLSSGTLLGAVRHKGFIPWDNDIDIEMPIEDYRRFLKLAQKSFPSGLFVQTYNTDKEFNELWCQIRKNNTTSLPIKLMKWKLHWGMHIDIFPLFGEYRNSVLAKLQRKLFVVCRTLLAKDYDMECNRNRLPAIGSYSSYICSQDGFVMPQ